MKSKYKKLVEVVSLAGLITGIIACNQAPHIHTYDAEWLTNDNAHWHKATCEHEDLKLVLGVHEFTDWEVTTAATEEEEGVQEHTCTVCGYKATETLAKLEHSWDYGKVTKAATCSEKGEVTYTCSVCGGTKTEEIPLEEHIWNSGEVTKEPTCTTTGLKVYTCYWGKETKQEVLPRKHQWAESETHVGLKDCTVCNKTLPDSDCFVKLGRVSFKMGDRSENVSQPVHKVTLSQEYWICDHEVTQAEFELVMGYNPSYYQGDDSSLKVADGEIQEKRPVDKVNWYEAITYCNKLSVLEGLTPCYQYEGSTELPALNVNTNSGRDIYLDTVTCDFKANGYRLPTEAEWEYAARAGDTDIQGNAYGGGVEALNIENYAWYRSNSNQRTHEVKTTRPNAFGIYDMSGNVSEWCWDWYSDNYSDYAAGAVDPKGPSEIPSSYMAYRTYRGNDCNAFSRWYLVVSQRSGLFPGYPTGAYVYYHTGLRVVRTAE